MSNSVAVVIFTKNPDPGNVKTRLIPELGEQGSYKLYCELLNHTLSTVNELNHIDKYIYTTPNVAHPFFNRYQTEYNFTIEKQTGIDLGMRMHNAFQNILSEHEACVLLGCDCPTLTVSILNNAVLGLNGNDIVIGPANDGGYYLIGLKQHNIKLFNGMNWSHSSVYKDTIERIEKENHSYIELERLTDVDNYNDLEKLKEINWINSYLV